MRIEAPTLQEAFQKAAEELGCSVTNIDIEKISLISEVIWFTRRKCLVCMYIVAWLKRLKHLYVGES